jgi:solute carrier family 25 carnitine/acylcarnitine transporter 20/29
MKDIYLQNYLNGWISGVNAILISHPIDTIKTNIQEKKQINFKFRSLYRGLSTPLLGVGLEKAIVFGTYEETMKYTNNHAISGAIAGLSASFIVTPFERVKILLQTNQTISKDMITPRFLFQGLSSTFYRETPGFAIYFTTYNALKNAKSDVNISVVNSFTFGAIAGSVSWLFIYPQDRIKTHVQALKDRKLGFFGGFKEILKEGGYRGFYRGFHFALMRAIPLHATAFMTYELCKIYL